MQPDSAGDLKPVSYTSRSLNPHERKYSPTEKEALRLVWSIEKFHLYLSHSQFQVIVDHQPLKFIFNSRSKYSPRIERWQMKLQAYTFDLMYKQGRSNIADFISRIRNNEQTKDAESTQLYLNFVTTNAVPLALSLDKIREESRLHPDLQRLQKAIRNNDFTNCPGYKKISQELCENDDIILRGNRIVIPNNLRKTLLDIIHSSCLGIVKTKSALRTKVYWPKMDDDVEQLIKTCTRCQIISKPIKQTPVTMTDLPNGPWEAIAADLYGDLPTGEKMLVFTDLYSKFPIIEVLRSTKFQTVGERFDNLFSIFGFPNKVRTDNGPPWDSYDFKRFLEQRNIKHEPSIPLWPRSNGQVERFMQTITKTVQHSSDWKQAIRQTLLHYRNTVHPATNETSAKLFLNRETNNGIPSSQHTTAPDYTNVKKHHESYITKAKLNADKRSADYKHSLQLGDEVLMKRGKKTKFQPTYFDDVFEVIEIQCSMITVQKENKQSYKPFVNGFKERKPTDDRDEKPAKKQYPLRSGTREGGVMYSSFEL